MQDNEKKPALRFKGFTDPWEQRKLKELYFQLTERNADLLPYQKTLSVATMSFKTDGNGAADTSLANYKRLRTGDIAFEGHTSKEFRYGRFVLNDVGDGIMSPRFSALRPLHEMPINFWKYYIHYEPIMRKVLVNSTKAGTMMNELVINEFLQESILVPSVAEQQAIGRFFKQLDTLITLHQRKYEKLVNIKKSMLDKMFPKNGASVPEIRFKGFTDPWEQRKLTNLCEKFTDGDWIEAKDQSDSGVRLVQTGNVGVTEYLDKPNNKKWISFETFEQLHCEEVYPGDILISRLPEPAGRACIMPNLGTKMITAVDCTIVRPNAVTSTRFLLQYLSSQAYFDAVNTCLAGGTRQRISRGNLAQFNVPIPSSKIEQEKIGEVLEKLDTLITLHQRKLEKLQNIKKSCLEKMFV